MARVLLAVVEEVEVVVDSSRDGYGLRILRAMIFS